MRRILIALTVVALLFVPQFAAADDVADLKAFMDKGVKAWNTMDAETIVSTQYPGMIGFGADNPFPTIRNKQAYLTELKTMFAAVDFITITPYNDQYKVVGDTGVSWGYYILNYKPKGGMAQTYYARYTLTAIKVDGKWQLLSMHESAIPTGN